MTIGCAADHHRDYFIYLLDYGWDEPLSEALRKNFGKMATLASEQKNAVVVMRTNPGVHFSDEVFHSQQCVFSIAFVRRERNIAKK